MLIVNEYEFGMIKNKTGLSDEELLALPEITIITQGEEGSTIYAERSRRCHIPVVPPDPLAEPTGVGDAYRAGVIKGMLRGLSLGDRRAASPPWPPPTCWSSTARRITTTRWASLRRATARCLATRRNWKPWTGQRCSQFSADNANANSIKE